MRSVRRNGTRSGGIEGPQLVELPAGIVLFRAYHDPNKDYGEWWSTPRELGLVADYFGRRGPAFDTGRDVGKGILHDALAVRHDWGNNSPDHLGLFFAVRLAAPLKAYHGEADHAPDASQTQMQRAGSIIDDTGRQRRVRQVMLPRPWDYKASMPRVLGPLSSQHMPVAVSRYSGQRLAFE